MMFAHVLHGKCYTIHLDKGDNLKGLRGRIYTEMQKDDPSCSPDDFEIMLQGRIIKEELTDALFEKAARDTIFRPLIRKIDESVNDEVDKLLLLHYHEFGDADGDLKEIGTSSKDDHQDDHKKFGIYLRTLVYSMYDRLVRGKLQVGEKEKLSAFLKACTTIKAKTEKIEVQEQVQRLCDLIQHGIDCYDKIITIHGGQAYRDLRDVIVAAKEKEKELKSVAEIITENEKIQVTFVCDAQESKIELNKALLCHFFPPRNKCMKVVVLMIKKESGFRSDLWKMPNL